MARRQIQVALETILRRLPDYEVDHTRLVRAETIGVTYGTFAMPITFTPGPRLLSLTLLRISAGTMADEPFIDTHIHFWDHSVEGLEWAWLKSGFTFRRWEGSGDAGRAALLAA